VIADNDYAGDPDSLVALAHQVLGPKARTVLVTCSALNRTFPSSILADRTAAIGAGIAKELVQRIAARMKAVWIGGGDYPAGGWEYNLMADLPAAPQVEDDGTYGAERPERRLTVCTRTDARIAFDDFLSLLLLNAREQPCR